MRKPTHITIFRFLILTPLPKLVKKMPPVHFEEIFFFLFQQEQAASVLLALANNKYKQPIFLAEMWTSTEDRGTAGVHSLAKFSFWKDVDVFKCC